MRSLSLIATVIGSLLIAICTASVPNEHAEDKDLKLLASGTVKVSVKADDAKTVKVSVGQSLEVALAKKIESGIITFDSDWFLENNDPKLVNLVSQSYFVPDASGSRKGNKVFNFVAVSPGVVELPFTRRQPWNFDPAFITHATVHVTVV
mmetsp:Transcript_27564/g.57303  ORF Transcript_27564/g.57303 Transcript_27564/m.57303 type:complete len:150 (-) Transcript_27564:95-544(-)